jgi:hypothetical protein
MLKIKDNIDLSKLEKFGFEKFGDYYRNVVGRTDIIIEQNTKILEIDVDIGYYSIDEYNDILYDLIKADMVEKVEN